MFVFAFYSDHRSLLVLTRSFPTRRSSDLVGVGGVVEIFVLRHAIGRRHARHAALQADRLVTLRLIFQRGVDRVLYGRAVGVAIDHRPLPAGPAQELIDRQARNLALDVPRSEEHTSELQSLMRISYAVFCLQKKNPLITRHASYPYYDTHNYTL